MGLNLNCGAVLLNSDVTFEDVNSKEIRRTVLDETISAKSK